MSRRRFKLAWLTGIGLLAMATAASSGCVGMWAQIGYLSGGALVPAQFAGLKGRRVAVVCVSDPNSYGNGSEAEVISRSVARQLEQHVEDIEVVGWHEVADWIDKTGWDEIDYRKVGRGVNADRVVAIDLVGFQLYEGTSLYRGRANVTVTVFDMTAGGKEVFRREVPEFTFPANSPYHAAETSEAKFRRAFLQMLSRRVAKHFYAYDAAEDFGDPALLRGT